MTARLAPEWHALDAPFTPPAVWHPTRGRCSRCGQPALAGVTRWWHLGDGCRGGRCAEFVPDPR